MTYSYSPPLHLGVLGGGQLGRMLIAPALRLGIHLHFLDKEGAPCQDCSPFFYKGSYMESQDILDFAQGLDALTIEIENVNSSALALLEERGMRVRPSARIINLAQDKLSQKQFYQKHNFPTAKLLAVIEGKADLQPQLKLLPAVQKIRKSGYDGYGVKLLRDKGDLAEALDAPSILEEKIDFSKEIAVLLARDSQGKIAAYPPVEMVFHPTANILEYLLCPAELEPQVQKKAYELSAELTESLDLIGLLAVELFLTNKGELLINEIAPRPHNSGHHSIDLCPVSQFEQHLRAIFDLPLGDTSCKAYGATLNLLGKPGTREDSRDIHSTYQGLAEALQIPGVFLHLYGKKEARPFRKMGHITVTAPSAHKMEVRKKLEHVREKVRVWAFD